MEKNSSLLDALQCRNQQRTPLWLMRQAGRYLPSYKAIRSRTSLLEMFHTSDLIVEVTHLPLKVLNLDAAIVFADLLTVLDGLSLKWDFKEEIGPIILSDFENTLKCPLRPPQEVYDYLGKAIRQLKQELCIPLLGFAGAPFTVASYLIEKKSSRDLIATKQLMYRDPARFHQLLSKVSDAIVELLNFQIDAGVDALQIFDSWANVLSLEDFRNVSLFYMASILKRLKKPIPVILFCRGSSFFAEELASLSPSAISLDWQADMSRIRAKLPHVALQGNLDPAVLLGSRACIQKEVDRILSSMKGDPGYIFNLGHGILPMTPFENVHYLVDYVRASTS